MADKEEKKKKKKKGAEKPESEMTAEEKKQAEEAEINRRAGKFADILALRKSARDLKRHIIAVRVMAITIVAIIVLISVTYAISYFYDKYGSFTVRVSKYDMVKQGLTLSETPEFQKSLSILNADIVYDMTNISGEDLPDNIDSINGSHNGSDFIAYTFYLINSGKDTLSYTGEMTIENVTKNLDEAIRVAVYLNGEKTIYGKTKSDGRGKEADCDKEFASSSLVMTTRKDKFADGAEDKYTVVIWLEGSDPECTDAVIGGTVKIGMNFKIIEGT